MNRLTLFAAVCGLALASCITIPRTSRPDRYYCPAPRDQQITKMVRLFMDRGYSITHSSLEAGSVQAEKPRGEFVQRWSVAVDGDTIRLSASSLYKPQNSIYSENFAILPNYLDNWVIQIADAVDSLCRPAIAPAAAGATPAPSQR